MGDSKYAPRRRLSLHFADWRRESGMTEPDRVVFIVDDDSSLRESLADLIRSVGLRVEAFASAQEFLRSKRSNMPSCLVLDVRLKGLSGLDLQKQLADAAGEIAHIAHT